MLKGHLTGMVKAASEEDFNANLQGARELIMNQPQVNGQLEEDLEELASLKNTYASYCHAQVPGNRGHHGNAISESNHSAVLSHLNDGDKNGNNFCEHPIVLIRELLKRQQKNMTQTNQLLFGHTTKMNTEKARLEGEPATQENIELLKAVHILNKPAYERFKARLNRAKLYRLDLSFLDPQHKRHAMRLSHCNILRPPLDYLQMLTVDANVTSVYSMKTCALMRFWRRAGSKSLCFCQSIWHVNL